MRYERELDVALAAARRAGELALRYQTNGLRQEQKADLSPVTIADRESEALLSRSLIEAFPADGLLGEEGANKVSGSGRRWIIDPIDGTRDFLRGFTSWAVLIALEKEKDIELGVCHFPAQNKTYYAVRGEGAWQDGTRLRTSNITEPSKALLCLNGFRDILAYPFAPALMDWIKQFWAVRSFGGCQDAVYVASGQAEAWVEPYGQAWDYASLKVINEEAGAVFFTFQGGNDIYGGNCAVCVPALESELRRFLCAS